MNETHMMHGMRYSGQDVSGWIATEKLDGVRAYWDGAAMWTRGGERIMVPDHWALPSGIALDGELFAGYGNRQLAVNAARYGRWDDRVRLMAFDAPSKPGNWVSRMGHIPCNQIVRPVAFQTVENIHHALEMMRSIQAGGGEGIMIRHTELTYMPGRTDLMLKIK